MLYQEDDDTINDDVRTVEPSIGTGTQKTDDELIIKAGGKEYDNLIKDQWTLNNKGKV
jgi:hypothetical protein